MSSKCHINKAKKSETTNCYNCEKCDEEASDVYPRIKVQIRVQDETGSASFWLFQPEICKLIGKSPGYLISKAKKDLDNASYPEDLNIMLNKHYVLKVQVSGYNLENNYHIFTANKITDDEDVMKSILAKRPIHKETHAICEDQNTHSKDENVYEEKNLICDDEDTYSEVGEKRKNNEQLHEVPVKASTEYKKAYKTEIPAESNCKGISKAATAAKISPLLAADSLTIPQIYTHLQKFRLRASKVDSFVEQNIQPSFVDTAEWTQDMLYYFKERWEKKINSEKANNTFMKNTFMKSQLNQVLSTRKPIRQKFQQKQIAKVFQKRT
ncbi:replication protein A 70 kDa DNA-binding subunit B [Artemisia annua]|uniref:Replication protein A 70 kDa DNA-binding subunit B n=1 Tax=Artemisia annua TaxID=35608 RepID=A0A2U1KWX2_ARTAN|nr:replication protein A 70 kDa DNA-binding subunit B [Artemisia annua]